MAKKDKEDGIYKIVELTIAASLAEATTDLMNV